MRALYRYGSDLIWSVGPKCPLAFDKIIFPRTADLYPTYKHDNQTRGGFCLVTLCNWNVPLHWARGFSEKRVKCLIWRKVGPARRLTLPLQKGDWTRWVSLPAEPNFCNLSGSPCFVKKCVKRCLFPEGSSGRLVILLLETNFFHISGD